MLYVCSMAISLTCTDEYNIVRFTTRRFYLWINGNLCESVPAENEKEKERETLYVRLFISKEKLFPPSNHVTTYCVLTRVRIGSPKYGGTFSSINEWVLMKFKVASGNARESL